MPQSRLFLWVASVCGVVAVIAMEAGWVVSEVGRQPWIVYEIMTVEDAATANTGIWVMTIIVGVVYTALAVALVYVLRTMARRFRTRDGDVGVPYGPSGDTPVALPDEETVGVP